MTHIRALSAADRREGAASPTAKKNPNRTAAHNSHSAPSSRGAGSPPSASARTAPRSPESAQGANSPNAPARGGGKQSRPAQQGKRFSARPSGVGGFGRMRGAGRVRGRRRGSPSVRRRDIFRYQLLSENIRARIPRMPRQGRGPSSPARGRRESVFPPARPHSADSGEYDNGSHEAIISLFHLPFRVRRVRRVRRRAGRGAPPGGQRGRRVLAAGGSDLGAGDPLGM